MPSPEPRLFGPRTGPVQIAYFCDDSKARSNQPWTYSCVLAIREADISPLIGLFRQYRQSAADYDGELHFTDISTDQKARVAQQYLTHVLYAGAPRIGFHVLGIDQSKLTRSDFGNRRSEQDQNSYVRFLRTNLAYAMKAITPPGSTARRIVHDGGDLEHLDRFPWHTVWRLTKDHALPFQVDEVQFSTSDHRSEGADPLFSHMIQLCDLVLGATRVCLDATTGKEHQLRLARMWLPLVDRLTDPRQARNRNSRYGHVGRCAVSFFPKQTLGFSGAAQLKEPSASLFYSTRRPRLLREPAGQLSLPGLLDP
jgi:hypothetical protein